MFGMADAQHPGGSQMFDGIPLHTEGAFYRQPYYEHVADMQRHDHLMDEQAHHPEVQVTGVRDNMSIKGIPELGHLDETPYEHDHVDFDSRFLEHVVVPHREVGHDAHGIQEPALLVRQHLGDDSHTHINPDDPTYDELLWTYQHGK